MFNGFDTKRIAVGDTDFHIRIGGSGPPVLLLHGFPQTHHAWHQVAPLLAERFTVIVPDTPGYGATHGPEPTVENFAKRALAQRCAGVMAALGFSRFHLAGHDRGARIGYRLALDTPERIDRLAMLDILPTAEVWQAMDAEAALSSYHWLLLAQNDPALQRLIGLDAPGYVRHLIDRWAHHRDRLDPAAVDAYAGSYTSPSVVAAMFADYRAGATLDRDLDRADRQAGKTITAPLLLLWGAHYLRERSRSHLDVWRDWAEDVTVERLDCGHFLAEEAAEPCADALFRFFTNES